MGDGYDVPLFAHADLEPVDHEQVTGITGGGQARIQFTSSVVGADGRRTGDYRRSVGLVRLDPGRMSAGGHDGRLHVLALHHHGAEVAADAASLEPGLTPNEVGQRIELAEVGRRLDGRTGQPQ